MAMSISYICQRRNKMELLERLRKQLEDLEQTANDMQDMNIEDLQLIINGGTKDVAYGTRTSYVNSLVDRITSILEVLEELEKLENLKQ